MSVFRVEKTKGYTVMSNHHLRNHTLSLKAKGLLSQMLSLPEDWDYTLQGLAQINKESIDAIREAVRELERAGYIERSRERDERGCLRGTVYTIYEQPHTEPTPEEPAQALPTLDNPTLEKPTIAVRKMVSGMLKLLYPDGDFGKEEVREVLTFALEMRRRVKEQLKKIGGMEFYDVNFSFVDNDSFEETFVSVPEQGGGKLIPDGMCNPGHIYTVSRGKSGMIGVYRLETQMLPGNGKLERTGLGTDREAKESTNTAFNYLKANANAISGNISTTSKDYIINYQDLNGIGITKHLALPTVIAICSVALSRPTVTGLAVLGDISISGTIMKVEDLANVLQVCLDSGAKKVLLPITSAADIGSVPSELVGAFSLIFYSTPQEAVFKALGVD